MRNKNKQNRKKSTIFRIFLIPLIAIMLVQSTITLGTLMFKGIMKTLEEYSSSMMSRLVENRMVILQNDMNQRWSAIQEQEELMNGFLEQFLQGEGISLEAFLQSSEEKVGLLEQLFPECLEILHNNGTTGVFLILTGTVTGERKQKAFQNLGYSIGHQLDYPVFHGRIRRKSF